MKLERTFVFAALMALAVLGYGITGAFVFEPERAVKCEEKCKQIISEAAESCLFNGTYFKKDFFANNFCAPELRNECLQQFCRPPLDVSKENSAECNKLCSR